MPAVHIASTSTAWHPARRLGAALLCAAALVLPVHAQTSTPQALIESLQREGQAVQALDGVAVLRGPLAGPAQRLALQQGLPAGTELLVPARCLIVLRTPNGARIELPSGTRFKLESMNAGGETHSLLAGLARFKLSRTLDFFNVDFNNFLALVRGTEFSLEVRGSDAVVARLDEGRLRVERPTRSRIDGASGGEGGAELDTSRVQLLRPGEVLQADPRLASDDYLQRFGSLAQAEAQFSAALQALEAAGGEADYDQRQAARNNLGTLRVTLGNAAAARAPLQAGLDEAQGRRDLPWLARMANNLGAAHTRLGDCPAALRALDLALQTNLSLYPDGLHRRVASNRNNRAQALLQCGRSGEALEELQQALRTNEQLAASPPAPSQLRALAGNHQNLGNLRMRLLLQAGEVPGCLRAGPCSEAALRALDEALGALHTALALQQQRLGEAPHPDTASVLASLGKAYGELGHHDVAVAWYRDALAQRLQVFGSGPNAPVADSRFDLGNALCRAGRCGEGIAQHEQALALEQALHPGGVHARVLQSLERLALLWREQGDATRADDYARRAAQMRAALQAAASAPR